MLVRKATPQDRAALLRIHQLAFGQNEESVLVENLLADPSAQPVLSLVADQDGTLVGHALFTRLSLLAPNEPPSASILAPLAVAPTAQRAGVGHSLIEAGCKQLAASGVRLLFVLGDPLYYLKQGFTPALPHGLRAPYTIEPEAAWMVRALGDYSLSHTHAQARCADALAPERYWRE
jgi:predicted N-acetyltransferase YhbS